MRTNTRPDLPASVASRNVCWNGGTNPWWHVCAQRAALAARAYPCTHTRAHTVSEAAGASQSTHKTQTTQHTHTHTHFQWSRKIRAHEAEIIKIQSVSRTQLLIFQPQFKQQEIVLPVRKHTHARALASANTRTQQFVLSSYLPRASAADRK